MSSGAGGAPQEGLAATREHCALLDRFSEAIGRDPATLERSLLVGFTSDPPLDSIDAFHEFVGRYAELGISEFTMSWIHGERTMVEKWHGRAFSDEETLRRFVADGIKPLLR